MTRAVCVGLVAVLLALVGCGESASTPTGPATPAEPPGTWGSIRGIVRLADGEDVPLRPPFTQRDTLNSETIPPECPPDRIEDRRDVTLGSGRGLGRVLVAASDFSAPNPPHEPTTHELHIRGCKLQPLFVSATEGDSLKIINDSPIPFTPTLGSDRMMHVLLEHQDRVIALPQAGATNVTCPISTPCGSTDVIVLHHAAHVLTGEDGRFVIERVTPGRMSVHAWHPLLLDNGASIEVRAGDTTEVELVLHVRPVAAPAPVVEPPADPNAPPPLL